MKFPNSEVDDRNFKIYTMNRKFRIILQIEKYFPHFCFFVNFRSNLEAIGNSPSLKLLVKKALSDATRRLKNTILNITHCNELKKIDHLMKETGGFATHLLRLMGWWIVRLLHRLRRRL